MSGPSGLAGGSGGEPARLRLSSDFRPNDMDSSCDVGLGFEIGGAGFLDRAERTEMNIAPVDFRPLA